MRTLIVATAIVLVGGCDSGPQTRTFPLAYMEPDVAFEMIEPYVPGGAENIRMTERPAALTITAPDVRLEQIAQVLDTYDRGRPDVQMRFQIIEADGFSEIDPAIADVQSALQDLFRFSGYRLLAEGVARAQAPGYVEQQLAAGDRQFSISARLDRVIGSGAERAVDLNITLREMAEGGLISTVMTVPSGQTVVVGSARARSDGNTLILVVRPEIQ